MLPPWELLILQNSPKTALFWKDFPAPLQVVTYSSVSFLIPNHSLIFFCRVPFWVSHLGGRGEVGCAALAGPPHRGPVQPSGEKNR